MSRFIKIPSALFNFAKLVKKNKPFYMRVIRIVDDLDPDVEYPFALQYRDAKSDHWVDLNRYDYWDDAHDALMRFVDRYEFAYLG